MKSNVYYIDAPPGAEAAAELHGAMQTFRAYVRDAAGTITWAAWIEAAHRAEAQLMADALALDPAPTLELWSATARGPIDPGRLEPV